MLKASNAVDEVGGGPCENLLHLVGMFSSLDSGQRGNIVISVALPMVARKMPGDGEGWMCRAE